MRLKRSYTDTSTGIQEEKANVCVHLNQGQGHFRSLGQDKVDPSITAVKMYKNHNSTTMSRSSSAHHHKTTLTRIVSESTTGIVAITPVTGHRETVQGKAPPDFFFFFFFLVHDDILYTSRWLFLELSRGSIRDAGAPPSSATAVPVTPPRRSASTSSTNQQQQQQQPESPSQP